MAKLPICHRVIVFKSLLKNDVSVVKRAFTNKDKTIPTRIIVLLDIALSIFVENTITENTVINPNINPTKGNVKLPITGIVIPLTTIRPAPKDAPEDTPNVYGDANSFFSTDCTTAPPVAKHPPTKNASNTLGSLNFQIIEISLAVILSAKDIFKVLFKIIDNVSIKLMSELPMDVPNKSIINIAIILKIDFFLFVIFIWISSFCYFL